METKEFDIENDYLNSTINLLKKTIKDNENISNTFSEKFNESNTEYLQGMRDMKLNSMNDDTMLELTQTQQNLEYLVDSVNQAEKEVKIFSKMLKKPYFAKITINMNEPKNENYYIGVHSLMDKNEFKIIDWRSPISEIFYNFDLGDAYIKIEDNKTYCKLINKRQFKIEDGSLIYYFDSDLTINDDILKDALGESKNNQMRSIIQTIQKEQNEIIRSNEYENLIVNGVAGSGKTAIALHRIAYLLYKLKNKLASENVVIISPNDAFSQYISTVLPELAEDDVKKIQLDNIIRKPLKKHFLLERKYEQMERLVSKQRYIDEYSFKFSFEFLQQLLAFCKKIQKTFIAKSITINDIVIDVSDIKYLFYDKFAHLDIFNRICFICDYIVSEKLYYITNQLKIKMIKQKIFEELYNMFETKNCVKLYSDFLSTLNLRLTLINGRIKNEDASPIFVIWSTLFGFNANSKIKHLVIDELQDYSAVQLYIISKIFPCTKTMLGDSEQSIIPNLAHNNFDNISEIMGGDFCNISLNKSYRPTYQIASFYNYINNSKNTTVVLRNGDNPKLINNISDIKKSIEVLKSKYNSIAIITKNNKQAREVFDLLSDNTIQLILNSSDILNSNICIISAFNSKGMEFDAVICYNVSKENFVSEYDRKLLYIMCSRALHNLFIHSDSAYPNYIRDYFNGLNKGE